PIHPEHEIGRTLSSANTSRTGRSLPEPTVGQPIIHLEDPRLTGRLLASEGEEVDLVPTQIDLTADQPVRPDLTQRPGLPQHDHLAVGTAPPQVDQPASGPLPQVELPVAREGAALRGGLDPRRPLPEHGRDVLPGAVPQLRQVAVPEAGPDLGLP